MLSIILLAMLTYVAMIQGSTAAAIAPLNLLAMQERIVLKRGVGGGVTIQPDPVAVNRSYDHGSRPLFGSQTGHAARQSARRYAPPPLITSQEVARAAVRPSIYGRRWGW